MVHQHSTMDHESEVVDTEEAQRLLSIALEGYCLLSKEQQERIANACKMVHCPKYTTIDQRGCDLYGGIFVCTTKTIVSSTDGRKFSLLAGRRLGSIPGLKNPISFVTQYAAEDCNFLFISHRTLKRHWPEYISFSQVNLFQLCRYVTEEQMKSMGNTMECIGFERGLTISTTQYIWSVLDGSILHEHMGTTYPSMMFGFLQEESFTTLSACYLIRIRKDLVHAYTQNNPLLKEKMTLLRVGALISCSAKAHHTFQKGDVPSYDDDDEEYEREMRINSDLLDPSSDDDEDEEEGKYKIVSIIGSGTFGRVYKVQDTKTARVFAMKSISGTGMTQKEQIRRELSALQSIKRFGHQHVIKIHDIKVNVNRLRIIMQLVEGGTTLRDIMNQTVGMMDTLHVSRIFSQIIKGVVFLHSCNVIHGDLKPENILMEDKGQRAILTDFGCSTTRDSIQSYGPAGTINYIAPETLRGYPPTTKSDTWSLGVILFEMLYLRPLFPSIHSICTADYTIPPNHIDPSIRNSVIQILSSCVLLNSQERPEPGDILRNSWFSSAKQLTKCICTSNHHPHTLSTITDVCESLQIKLEVQDHPPTKGGPFVCILVSTQVEYIHRLSKTCMGVIVILDNGQDISGEMIKAGALVCYSKPISPQALRVVMSAIKV